jgi:polar amino acid transport system substrate-binding protein
MMFMLRLVLLLFTALLPLPSLANYPHSSLIIAFSLDRPPFIFQQKERGIEVDIIRHALALRGYEVQPVFLSNRELNLELARRNNPLDAAATINTELDIDGLYYSDDYIRYQNIAVSLASKQIRLNSIEDLANYTVAAWKGAQHDVGEPFKSIVQQSSPHQYFEYNDQERHNLELWRSIVDVLVIDRSLWMSW